jgi:D-aminopeptidase
MPIEDEKTMEGAPIGPSPSMMGEAPRIPPQVGPRARARDLGIVVGHIQPGRHNAITDVEGIRVGHSTIIHGSGKLRVGRGPVRTGVTAIVPKSANIFMERLVGGGFVLNGAGEVSGLTQVVEWGLIESPLMLTNTLSVGTVADAAVRYMVDKHPGIGREHDTIIPLVGECDDSWLNDIAGRHVRPVHVYEAIDNAASGPVAEGNVGGGTGMITCDFSGGIGTSSRVLPKDEGGYTVGVLVQSNFGRLIDLHMAGVPVGQLLAPMYAHRQTRGQVYGSIIAIVATDAPLSSHQLTRLSKRCALGIGRAGSYAGHGSGEIVVSFSTANVFPRSGRKRVFQMDVLNDEFIDPLYRATIDATEEAILNALCMSADLDGCNGHSAPGLPLDLVREIIARYHVPYIHGDVPKPLRAKRDYATPLDQVFPKVKPSGGKP